MLLTIITINYNNAAGLQKTVESVVNQTSHDFEYIIVDGASTDGSVEFLQTFKLSNFQTLNFISEPDSGIYNAMNKGIRMAKGDYIHFLNSGDWLVDEQVIEKMLKHIKNQEPRVKSQDIENQIDILVGNVISVRPDGKRRYKQNTKEVSLYTFYRGTIEHTSAYLRRALFDHFGLYDESLRIVSDWKWYLQVAGLRKANVKFTDTYVTCFDTTGISSTNLKLDRAERRQVLEELLPAPILADYDKYSFDIDQMQRLKKYPVFYKMVWFIERLLFKLDKWVLKNREWK